MKVGALLVLVVAATPGGSGGNAFPSLEEALVVSFGKSKVVSSVVEFSEPEHSALQTKFGRNVQSSYELYKASGKEGELVGMAIVLRQRVKTKNQLLFLSWDEDGALLTPQALGFAEPLQYLPRASWYGQFAGHQLNDELNLQRGIDGISGATISARTTVKAARLALAIDEIIAAR